MGCKGTVLSGYMGMPGPADDTDVEVPTQAPRKRLGAGADAGGGLFAAGGGGLLPDGLAVAIAASNLGEITDAALADADPLGVNQNLTFDEVGGLMNANHFLTIYVSLILTITIRHQLIEGDDSPSPPIPGSFPALQSRTSTGCIISRSARNW